jgi:hypothetical protein
MTKSSMGTVRMGREARVRTNRAVTTINHLLGRHHPRRDWDSGPIRAYVVFCAALMKDRAFAELSPAERARQLGQMWRETSAKEKSQ